MNKMNKDEILKALDLDFSKYDYYGDGIVHRVDGSGKTEAFVGGKWVKTDFDIAKKAACIFDGGMDIDVFENRQSSIDYMVEMAIESELEEPDVDNIENIIKPEIYLDRYKNINQDTTGHDLLNIEDWSKITPDELNKHIQRGEIVNWIDGYDVGPSPLTNALQQGASSEIIAILVANGADINAPTVLTDGTKKTPLEIVRSQEPTHDNMQKELILLRAGAADDIVNWLRKHKKKLSNPGQEYNDLSWMFKKDYCLRKNLHFLGYYNGAKVFQCDQSYCYLFEHAGKIWFDVDFDIYDKGLRLNHFSGPEPEWLNNELGDKFAKEFFVKCEKINPNVAMDQYYTYLGSLYLSVDEKRKRINAAQKDLREHFSYNDWTELMYVTPNVTARAEYNKIRKAKFPEIYVWDHMDD